MRNLVLTVDIDSRQPAYERLMGFLKQCTDQFEAACPDKSPTRLRTSTTAEFSKTGWTYTEKTTKHSCCLGFDYTDQFWYEIINVFNTIMLHVYQTSGMSIKTFANRDTMPIVVFRYLSINNLIKFTIVYNADIENRDRIVQDKHQGQKYFGRKMTVLGEYDPDTILSYYNKQHTKMPFLDDRGDPHCVYMDSVRYALFQQNKTCVCCGVTGNIMRLEKDKKAPDFNEHFNLYAQVDGKTILMTKDHIVPRSQGGKDHISNLQTMCFICNSLKGWQHMPLDLLKQKRADYDANRQHVREVVAGAKSAKKKQANRELADHMEVFGEYTLDEVLPFYVPDVAPFKRGDTQKEFKDTQGKSHSIHMTSLRYATFQQSNKCACCGVEGNVMRLERHKGHATPGRPHFNMYVKQDGKYTLMTKDHIVPKSKGGLDELGNLQTMCCICNTLKSSHDVTMDELRVLKKEYDVRQQQEIESVESTQ